MKNILLFVSLVILLTACGTQGGGTSPDVSDDSMTTRHQAEIPAEYKGLTNPIPSNEESLTRGAELYSTNCASCHGNDGMGDGPVGSALNPPPAPVAHTSQMTADDYLFWRLSEGGVPFNTSMPPWKVLDEQARWDLVNYIRTLDPAAPSSP
jgi:mono/diheme cytochrome c family protein